jgi:hypothetical protein
VIFLLFPHVYISYQPIINQHLFYVYSPNFALPFLASATKIADVKVAVQVSDTTMIAKDVLLATNKSLKYNV